MFNHQFLLGSCQVGQNCTPVFLPDIGTFFNQDIEQAEQMIRQLAESGVKIVKGEILQRPDIALDIDYYDEYLTEHQTLTKENYRKLIERKVVSLDSYAKLFSLCHSLGLEVVVSVYDFAGADFAVQQGCVGLKVASSNITHQPLIEYVVKTGLPIIMDTGRASLAEISQAVHWAKLAGARNVIVQHSPKAPPVSVSEHNLRFMLTLQQMFGVEVGLSDHHAGNEMLLAATAMDVAVLEKGVYMDGSPLDQGVYHSMPVSQVGSVVKQIEQIHQALGSGCAPLESKPHRARMGLVAKMDLSPGQTLDLSTVDFAFPVMGIGTEHWLKVNGAELKRSLKKGEVIQWRDVSCLEN